MSFADRFSYFQLIPDGLFSKKRLSQRTLFALLETVEIQMGAGVEFGQILQGFLARAKKRGLYKREQILLARIISKIKSGSTLSDAMRPHLNDTQYILVASGESSGSLDKVIRLLLDLDVKKEQIKSTFKSAMTAPIVYIVTLIITLIVISKEVLPAMAAILPPSKWTGMAAIVYESTLLLKPEGLVLIFAAIGFLYVVIKFVLPRWTGGNRALAEKYIPGFSFYRNYQGALWIGTFGAMLQAGMADTHVLQVQMAQATPWLAERLQKILILMKEGFSFGDAVVYAGPGRVDRSRPDKGVKFDFPSPEINDDIANFAGFGGFEEKLLSMRDKWMDKQEKTIKSNLGIVSLSIQGIVFGYFILFTLGINGLSSQISAAVGT